jgi:hypothetical protein
VWRDEEGKGQNGPGCGGTTEGRREMPRWMADLGPAHGERDILQKLLPVRSPASSPYVQDRTVFLLLPAVCAALRCTARHGNAPHCTSSTSLYEHG